MKFSKKISEEMEKKNDRLAQIKKIGVHDCCGRTSKVIAFYESMTKSGLMSHHLVFGCVNGTTVFFTLTEDEVIEKIREIPDKRKAPTSEKVLVKMLAARMEKIFEILNRFMQHGEMKDMACLNRNQLYFDDLRPVFNMMLDVKDMLRCDDLSLMSQFVTGLAWSDMQYIKDTSLVVAVKPYPHLDGRPWHLRDDESEVMMEAKKTFFRPDVTPEIVAQAWKMCSVGMVMKG